MQEHGIDPVNPTLTEDDAVFFPNEGTARLSSLTIEARRSVESGSVDSVAVSAALDSRRPAAALSKLLGGIGVNVWDPRRGAAAARLAGAGADDRGGGMLTHGERRRLTLAKRRHVAHSYSECPHCAVNQRTLSGFNRRLSNATGKESKLSAKELAMFEKLNGDTRCTRCLEKEGLSPGNIVEMPDLGDEMIKLRMSIRSSMST